MTPTAIRQFIAIFGNPAIAKGTLYEEPTRKRPQPVAFIMGQQDYLARLLHIGPITCPYVPDTPDARLWAAGKFRERKAERVVVEAYARTGRLA